MYRDVHTINQAYVGNAQKGQNFTPLSTSYDVQGRNGYWDIPSFEILMSQLHFNPYRLALTRLKRSNCLLSGLLYVVSPFLTSPTPETVPAATPSVLVREPNSSGRTDHRKFIKSWRPISVSNFKLAANAPCTAVALYRTDEPFRLGYMETPTNIIT